jgi:transposase
MAKALSVDLRRCVVSAIESGLSCRAAGVRFGVSASSAMRWRARERREGAVAPRRQDGERTSHRIEAPERILSALAEKSDITLTELRAERRRKWWFSNGRDARRARQSSALGARP